MTPINRINKDRALLDYSVKPDYAVLCEYIDILESRYNFLSVTSIGESVLSKKIFMLTLGNEKADKSVLYVGAHHGSEWITTLVLLRFINELCEYYSQRKQPFGININTLFSNRCLKIIPQLNPDGVDIQINGVSQNNVLYDRLTKMSGEDFSHWQSNARGVDLNHNYNAGFEEYKRLEAENLIFAGPTRFSGAYPFSEPETAAISSLLKFDSTVRMVLSLHSAGEEIYCSSGPSVTEKIINIGKKLSAVSGYKLGTPEGLAAFGGLTDWVIGELGIPSFTIECGKGQNPISCNRYFEIYAAVREMLMIAPLLI